ncbi:putative DNA resolvase [Sphingomonas changbaiensis NBRC 104936]|uniref:Putative DNA resolvase n=1 Tax=Sphingomonas changbaiensis NBRC 104936 TaxID=1219043 RepID=A0A0E9MNU1_9SPHN|nr:recombinase family protein [Sphingomonas changbaiensis]GAO39219.1 putative DNA resolvase [Sphingomonas changbaiensis NBRC 104936]
MFVGYARTSTVDQVAGLEAQERDLARATGCTGEIKIFVEQVSSVSDRPQLRAALEFVREGDAFIVTRLDRLARSTSDLLSILDVLERKGVALRILDFGGSEVDTKSPSGRFLVTMFGAVAQFERELLLQRQREGIAKAKAEGKYRGRAPTARRKAALMRQLHSEGLKPAEIAARTQTSRASVYRLLSEETGKTNRPAPTANAGKTNEPALPESAGT